MMTKLCSHRRKRDCSVNQRLWRKHLTVLEREGLQRRGKDKMESQPQKGEKKKALWLPQLQLLPRKQLGGKKSLPRLPIPSANGDRQPRPILPPHCHLRPPQQQSVIERTKRTKIFLQRKVKNSLNPHRLLLQYSTIT